MKLWISKIIILLFYFIPVVASADYGSGTASVSCDKNTNILSISTYILWNEDYDAFLATNPSGYFINKETAVYPLDQIKGSQSFICELNKSNLTVKLSSVLLQVLNENDTIIYEFKDRYPYGRNIYGLGKIKNYKLNISSNGKVTECFSVSNGEVSCNFYENN